MAEEFCLLPLSKVVRAARLEPIEMHHRFGFALSVAITLRGLYQLNAVCDI